MDLSPEEVAEFMAAEKVVPGDPEQAISWSASIPSKRWWRGGVEVEGQRVGEVFLLATPALYRACNFQLSYRGVQVYRVDVKPGPPNHSNPLGCPVDGFPRRKIKCREHEHLWVQGLDCKCARDLEGFETASDEVVFAEFCRRARIRFEPGYDSPFKFAQEPLL